MAQQIKEDVEKAGEKTRPKRSRRRRAGLWAMRGLFLLVLLAGFTALMVVGQTMHAPVWLKDRVEARLERALGGLQIRFGDVSFIIHEGWRPRLRLTDVTVSDADGRQIAEVADMRASLAMRPLLRGHVRPKRIMLRGALVSLVRDETGSLSLTVGSESAPVRQAPNLAQLIEQSDQVFLSPALSAMTSVEISGITLDYRDLRQGRSWTFDGGHIQATRGEHEVRLATGFSVLGGRDYVSSIEANYTSTLGSPAAKFGVTVTDLPAEDIAGQSPAMAWLQVLRTPISGALRGSIDAQGTLGAVFATLNLGAGAVQPNPETRPIPFESARTYFTYEPRQQVLDFNEVSIVSEWGAVRAEGKAFLQGVENGALENLSAQFVLSGIKVNPEDLFPQPLELSRATVDFQMKLAPFRLQLGQMTVEHRDTRLMVSGDMTGSSEGWDVAVDASIDRMTPVQLLSYWPEAVADKPREWVTENLIEGTLSDLDLAFRVQPGEKPDIYADFDFDKAKIRFAKTLPPIENAQGQASLVGQRFSVTARRGVVNPDEGGPVDASGTSFIIPDISIKKSAPGIARIRANGSATAALSLLDRPPLEVMTKAGLPVDLAKGNVSLQGTLALPLKDKVMLDDMEFHFVGDLSDVDSDKLVPGVNVSAQRLNVSGDHTQVTITGDGFFGAVPVRATWSQPIGGKEPERSELTGKIELSRQLMKEIRAGLPDDAISGQGEADFTVTLGAGAPPKLTAKSDLVGVRLAIPELGWRKSAGTAGSLTAEATLGKQMRVDALKIDAAGLRANATISFKANQQLDRVSFSSFELGNWLAVPAQLIESGKTIPDIRILGGVLNLQKSTFGSGGGGGSAGAGPALNVVLDRLQITETIALTGLRGNFTTTGGLAGNFTAFVNGGAAVSGQVVSRGPRSGVTLRSDNAGAVLNSAGLITQVRGGTLQFQLEPVGSPGNYDAGLKITNTHVRDAPAMAALLDAISLVGLLDELSGQGIFFSSIESQMRISPTQVTVLSGSAAGPSMGLSFDGRVDTERGLLDLQGAISPLYLVNAIGSVFTRKGEGIFAFNYTLKGPLRSPKVSVNPISGLAPLFLRDLMRSPAPKVQGGQNIVLPETPQSQRSFESESGDR